MKNKHLFMVKLQERNGFYAISLPKPLIEWLSWHKGQRLCVLCNSDKYLEIKPITKHHGVKK